MDEKTIINERHSSNNIYYEYSTRFKDKKNADTYYNSENPSLLSYFQLKNKMPLREFLAGWLTAVAEIRAMNYMLKKCPGVSIVDVPCGTGKLLPTFIIEDKSVLALDASFEMLSKSKDLMKDGIHFALSDIRYIPIRDCSIDIVISNRFFHRIPPDNYSDSFREIFRISRKYAILYFSVKNSLTEIIIYFEKLFNIGDRGTIYYIRKSAIKTEVEKYGFHFVEGINVLPLLSTGYLILVKKENL